MKDKEEDIIVSQEEAKEMIDTISQMYEAYTKAIAPNSLPSPFESISTSEKNGWYNAFVIASAFSQKLMMKELREYQEIEAIHEAEEQKAKLKKEAKIITNKKKIITLE